MNFYRSILSITVFLFFWLFINLFSQMANKLRVIDEVQFLTNELIDNDIKDRNGEVCAGIKILSDIQGLTFDSNNGIVKINNKQGENFLFLSPDERVITIYGPGYLPLKLILNNIGIYLKSGKVWQIKITGDKKLNLIPINIITEPKDVRLVIDGSNYNSNSAIQLSPGKHQININKSGYKSISKEIEVTASKTLFSFNLKKVNIIPVTIKSIPEGAAIYLNNAEKGTTNDQFFEYPGSYKLRLIKSGYLNYEQTITITESNENIFSFNLIKNSGIISFEVIPTDAEVRINTELQTGRNIELLPGNYEVEITKSGYLPQKEIIELKLGDYITKKYNLIKNSSQISLEITPPDAIVLLNKRNYSGKKKFEIAPGRYQLEINKEGYYPIEETIEVVLGKPLSKKYNLNKKTGTLQFRIKPIEAKVKLLRHGIKILNWQGIKYLSDLQVGDYKIEAKAKGYKTYRIGLKINENKTAEINIIMEKGSDITQNMVIVEGGTFQMGSTIGGSDEKPVHNVTLSSFYISKYEVTQAEWRAVMETNPSNFSGDKLPVEQVSWYDAVEYCNKLSEMEGLDKFYTISGSKVTMNWGSKGYRLPTEAEWEYACRGGIHSASYTYSGSNTIGDVAWYYGNSGNKTHEVGTKSPNELGIYDMSGNVWEWCNDWYSPSYYGRNHANDPRGPNSGTRRVFRGGSWSYRANYCRSAFRYSISPGVSISNIGFRFARTR